MSSMMHIHSSTLLGTFLVLSILNVQLEAHLHVGYYSKSCPSAESIVKEEVEKGFQNNRGIAPGLLRMHFHDCFVRGCDGSVLIDSTSSNTAEKDSFVNNPILRGFEIIDNAKTRIESTCKGIVSCADILAFAARESVVITGGPMYAVPAGRRDGRVSLASDVPISVPPPTLNLDQLTQHFTKRGLTQEEMVTLAGAHTIGRAHCIAVQNRLYNFNGTDGPDPSLDSNYETQLQRQCPPGSNENNPGPIVIMDPSSPLTMDTSYYNNTINNRALFTSDQSFMTDSKTASQVHHYARNQDLWKSKFAKAIVKMGKIDVLTDTEGDTGKLQGYQLESVCVSSFKAGKQTLQILECCSVLQ